MPISLTWDSREKTILLRWKGLFSLGWKKGRRVATLFQIPIPFRFRRKKGGDIPLPPMGWVHAKEAFSFLRQWRIERAEGTFSFADPMINGVLCGWMSAFESGRENPRFNLVPNFLGENWCCGEAMVSLKTAFHYFRRVLLLLFKRRREPPKGGGRGWRRAI